MSYYLVITFSFSIAIAAIIGLVRFKNINQAYYPFLTLIWIGLITEIIGFICTKNGYSNTATYNIYVLIEAIILTSQFKSWGLFDRARSLFIILLCSYIAFWTVECFVLHRFYRNASYFRVYYSFVIVLMSINIINRELMTDTHNLFRNAKFLICTAFVIYYIYKVIVGIFWIYGFGASRSFRYHLVIIIPYVNLFANLIFALAVLWMPKKHRFSLQF